MVLKKLAKNFMCLCILSALLLFFLLPAPASAEDVSIIYKMNISETAKKLCRDQYDTFEIKIYKYNSSSKKWDYETLTTTECKNSDGTRIDGMEKDSKYLLKINQDTSDFKGQLEFTAKDGDVGTLSVTAKTESGGSPGGSTSASPSSESSSGSTATPTPTVSENQLAFDNGAGSGSSDFSSTMTPPDLPAYGYDDEPSTGWKAFGKKIMDVLGWVAGTVFVGVLLIGAVMYIVAGTNEQQAESAKKAIYGAIIGIAVVAFAWTIVTFIAGEFSPPSSSLTNSPTATDASKDTKTK